VTEDGESRRFGNESEVPVEGKSPGVDLLSVHEHGGALSSAAPGEGITNECGADSPPVDGGIDGETLEVTDRAGPAGDVIADDLVTKRCHPEAGMGSGDTGVEETRLIELPERIERSTVNVQDIGDIGVPPPAKVEAGNARVRNVADRVTQEVKALMNDKPDIDERKLFGQGHRRREDCGESRRPNVVEGALEPPDRRCLTGGRAQKGDRLITLPWPDPQPISTTGDGVRSSHGDGRRLRPRWRR
jgi:hypothetical protein